MRPSLLRLTAAAGATAAVLAASPSAQASGTLQVKVSETGASGAATDNCDTGGITWKAATG
jgi:hypothetical protein